LGRPGGRQGSRLKPKPGSFSQKGEQLGLSLSWGQKSRNTRGGRQVHVVIVAHPTKSAAWLNESPGLYDIAGSAEWFNKTDNGIVVNRRKVELEDGDVVSTRQVEISVKKVRNREAGKLGSAWLLYDAKTRSYSDLQMDLGCEEDDAVPQRAQARTSAHA
ncbi:unnamed protein product, partial [Effrenium voratum]